MGHHVSEKVLLEPIKAPRIHADGLARVSAHNGQVTFILYVDPLALDPESACDEIHVECVVTMPVEAVMPAITATIMELTRYGGAALLGRSKIGVSH